MLNMLTAGIVNDAVALNEERYVEHKGDTIDLATAYRGLVRALRAIDENGTSARDAVDAAVGWDTMLQLDGTAEAFTARTQQDKLLTVCEQFGRLSNFVVPFLSAFSFSANNAKGSVRD